MKITSNKGFYIGDLCYINRDDIYYGIWGNANYTSGKYTDPESTFSFCIASLPNGDQACCDSNGTIYAIDGGNIAIVPLELVPEDIKDHLNDYAYIYEGCGTAEFEIDDDQYAIFITLPTEKFSIDTDWHDEEDYDEEDYDEKDYD